VNDVCAKGEEVLLNDLIRPQQERRRDGEAEGVGGLEEEKTTSLAISFRN